MRRTLPWGGIPEMESCESGGTWGRRRGGAGSSLVGGSVLRRALQFADSAHTERSRDSVLSLHLAMACVPGSRGRPSAQALQVCEQSTSCEHCTDLIEKSPHSPHRASAIGIAPIEDRATSVPVECGV